MPHLHTISPMQVFLNRRQILRNPLPFHRKNFDKYGDVFRVKPPFGKPVLFSRDASVIRHILRKSHRSYEKSGLQSEEMARYIGKGILTATGEHWRTHRRMIQPAFHRQKLQSLVEVMEATIGAQLDKIVPGTTMDVFPLMGDLAFQVVARGLFSRDDLGDRMQELKNITESNQKMLISEMRQPYLKWWFGLSGRIRKHLRLSEKSREILNGIIKERIASGAEKDDLLDMLIKARYEDGSPMSGKQLIDEVLILFAAGHETTANALSFILFLLAKHPDIQEKASLEAIAFRSRPSQLLAISEKAYIQCCIEEGMRLFPPVYVIDRVALQDDAIGDLKVPMGSLILMSIFELHRNELFWGDPEAFRPERFAPGGIRDLNDYYYPFGAGPRKCVGNNFAMYEMILTLAMILADYRLEPATEALDIRPLISLKPGRVPVKFVSRPTT
jgi:cytochrome P450